MLNRIITLFAVALAGLPAFAAQETLDLKNLIDLSGFNFTVTGVRTVDDQLQLGDHSTSIKDEYKKDHHYVIFSLKGQVDRPGAYILSPHAFVAEYIADNSWKIEPATAVGTKIVLMGGKEQTFWAQSGLAVTLSVTAEKKGADENLEIVFILPRNATIVKLGTAKFVAESVAIPSP
jgi:hypothetical protein